ncbi:MAG: VPS10 domain-containing protein, partial [Gemmatimonadales bacterium]
SRPARAAPARADTARADTAAAKDSLTRFVESFSWRLLGPAAYSGRITALAVPANAGPRPKTFYAGAAGGGVWKTVNGGTTWQSVSTGLGVQTIGDLAVAPSDSGLLWVGTGEKNSLRSQWWGDGVYKSTDGARSWTKMGLGDTRSIGRIVIHPTAPDTVYVAALGHLWGPNGERGVFKTADGGKTWTKILFVNDSTGFVDLEMDPADPSILYAAAWHRVRWGGGHMQGVGPGSGIYKTTDGGRTWTRLTDPALKNGLPTDRMGRIGLAIARTDPRVIYAMIQVDRGITDPAQGRYGGVFRSGDGGATWTQVNDLQAIPHYYYDEIWVDPTNAEQVFIASTWLLRSKDGGKTFAQDSLHRVHVDHHALWIDPADPQHLILGNDGGVYLTRDGGKAWEHMALPVGQFYTVMVDSSLTPYQVCGGLQDNGVWCGPSATKDEAGITDADWYSVNGGDGMWVQIPPDDPHTVYSGWQFGNISRLDLRTWRRDNITPQILDAGRESGYRLTWGWTTPIVLSQHDPTVLYLGANHLVRLTKRGDDFEILGPDMTRAARQNPAPEVGHTSYHAIFAIAESPRRAAILWTGSDDGLVWASRDTGRTWTNVTGNLPRGAPTNCWVGTLVASAHADGVAYAVLDCHFRDDYRPHVYRTADVGRTWTEIGQGLPAEFGSLTIFESPRNPRVLWVGNAIGVYVTTDGGRSWRRLGRNLPRTAVERIAMSYAQRDLVVSTHGRGLWVLGAGPLEEVADTLFAQAAHLFEVPPALVAREADTYPSFGSRPFVAPNPPKGGVITYYVREVQPDGVKLVVTAAAGDTIRTLNGPGYAGVQRVTWDLMRDRPRARELGGPTSREELRRVLAGEYTVHLTVGKLKLERKVVVRDWPADRLGRVR